MHYPPRALFWLAAAPFAVMLPACGQSGMIGPVAYSGDEARGDVDVYPATGSGSDSDSASDSGTPSDPGTGLGSDTDGDTDLGYSACPNNGDPCKILPLGDSITFGMGVSGEGGYRIELFHLALQDGKNITFVGREQNGPARVDGQPFPRNHEGHSGWTISQIDGKVPSPFLEVDPHIILLHIGTNDMWGGATGAEGRLAALIDQIIDDNPQVLLVVSTIIPFPANASKVAAYNAAIPGVVDTRINEGAHLILVDQFTDFPQSELADGVHPNADGYARMAGVWYEAISSYLL